MLRLTFLCVLLAFIGSAGAAWGAGPAQVADALAVVHATAAINQQRDAGPELTAVKTALRAFVEDHLSEVSQDGDGEKLASRLNRELQAAGLTCDDMVNPPCSPGYASLFDARGHVGGIRFERLEDRYLLLTTEVGIRCGYDQSAYIYAWRDGGWKLLSASEQDDYAGPRYAPQNLLHVLVTPPGVAWNEPAPPPLVLTLGYSPSCASNWQALYTRLWRSTWSSAAPRRLIDRVDTLYMGDDQVADARLTKDDILIEFRGRSIDGGVLVRSVVWHYRLGPGDTLERIAPIALDPFDFVDEWLTRPWQEAEAWTNAATRASLGRWHRRFDANLVLGDADTPPRRCRGDPTMWQVTFAREIDRGSKFDEEPATYFLVRWLAPYRFTLMAVGRRPRRDCDVDDPLSDNIGTLFPVHPPSHVTIYAGPR